MADRFVPGVHYMRWGRNSPSPEGSEQAHIMNRQEIEIETILEMMLVGRLEMPLGISQLVSIMLQMYRNNFQTLYIASHFQMTVLEIEVRGVFQLDHTGHEQITSVIIELTVQVFMIGLFVLLS